MIAQFAVLLLTLVIPPADCAQATAFWRDEYQHARLQTFVRDHDLPTNAPIRLRTDFYATVIPDIARNFPGQHMDVHTQAIHEPHVTCNGATVASVGVRVHQLVRAEDRGMVHPLFALQFDIAFDPRKAFEGSHPLGTAHMVGNARLMDEFIHVDRSGFDEFLRMEPFYLQGPYGYF